jgi:histidinol-phosphatase
VNDDLAFAHALADAADAITLPRFRALDLHVETKPDLTPVSEADRAAEEAIRALVAARPGEGVLGEEFGDDGGDVRWIVDPIDGTRNYVRGVPVWATLLSLERDGVMDVAVVSAPALKRRWWAARGEGAWAGDGERLQVSAVSRIEDAVISTTTESAMPPGWRGLAERAWTPRGFGDFWQHCLVAEGAVDLATDPVLALWDYAAVQLIVEEAGGRCTTFSGDPPAPGHSFLAANAALHAAAVRALYRK